MMTVLDSGLSPKTFNSKDKTVNIKSRFAIQVVFSYLPVLMSTTLKTCLPVLLYRTNEQRKSMISTPPQTELTSNSSVSAVSKSTSTTSASSYQTSREQFAATRKGSARSNRLSNLPRSSATASSSSFQQQQPGAATAAAAFDAVLAVDDSVEEWAKLQEEADKLYAKVAAEADDTFMGLRPPSRSPYRQGAVMCRGADFYDTFNNYIYDGGLGRYKNR
jgi:hypothetical protein